MEQPQVTLGYWDMRGLGERVRHLLEYLSIPYNEAKYAGQEGRKKWFDEVKPQLLQKNPVVTLPYLLDGDKVIAEAEAISVHLCYKAGKPELLGRNAEEEVAIATAHGIYKDFYPSYIKLVYGNYDQKFTFEQALAENTERIQEFLERLAGLLENSQYIAGQLTWFDFTLADLIQTLSILSPSSLKAFPKLVEYYQRVWGLPNLKEYFSSERFKERPCNNYTAAWK